MEKMNIDINLSGQEEGKFRGFYLVLGACGLAYLTLSVALPDISIGYLAWVAFLPGIIESVLYGLGRTRRFADRFPYLRINEEKIESSKGGLFSKAEVVYWTNVKAIDVKLFEIQLITHDNKASSIDLTKLTDDNLKIVKDFVLTIKKNKGL